MKWTPAKLLEHLRVTIHRMEGYTGKKPEVLALTQAQWQVVVDQFKERHPVLRTQWSEGRVYFDDVLLHMVGANPDETVLRPPEPVR